jgi:hypothetical protein
MFNSVDRGCDSCMGGSIILSDGDCRKHTFVTCCECTAAAPWRLLLDSFPAPSMVRPSRASSSSPPPDRVSPSLRRSSSCLRPPASGLRHHFLSRIGFCQSRWGWAGAKVWGPKGGGAKGWGRRKSPTEPKICKPRRKSPTTCKNREQAIHTICHERPKSRKIDRKSPKSGKTFQGTPLERFPRLRGFSHPKLRTHPKTARKPLVFKGIFVQKSLENQCFLKVFASFLEGFGCFFKKPLKMARFW